MLQRVAAGKSNRLIAAELSISFIGLALQENGWWCGPIERIKWDGERQLFTAESRDEAPDPEADFEKTAEEIRDKDMSDYNWQSYHKK